MAGSSDDSEAAKPLSSPESTGADGNAAAKSAGKRVGQRKRPAGPRATRKRLVDVTLRGALSDVTSKSSSSGDDSSSLNDFQQRALSRAAQTQHLTLTCQRLEHLPPEVLELDKLLHLNVASNSFHSLPPQFGKAMSSLEHFDASNNDFEHLPPSLLETPQLRHLTMRNNRLFALSAHLPLASLETLVLTGNLIDVLPPLDSCENLTELDCSRNRLRSFPAPLSQSLRLLRLAHNLIDSIPDELPELSTLTEVDLSTNRLVSLPASIAQMSSVVKFDLSNNNIAELTVEATRSWSSLSELRLGHNRLTTLPSGASQWTSLRKLSLVNNEIAELPDEMWRLEALQYLNLSANRLTDVSPQLGMLTSLRELILGANQLTVVPLGVLQLTALTALDISQNQIENLPNELGELTQVSSLHMSGNRLTELPEQLGELKLLKDCCVSNNRLTTLPGSFGELRGLEVIDLAANAFESLPECISKISFLESLDASHCTKLVDVPTEVTRSKILEVQLHGTPFVEAAKQSGSTSVRQASTRTNRSAPRSPRVSSPRSTGSDGSGSGGSAGPIQNAFKSLSLDQGHPFRVGCISSRGRRWSQEDAVVLLPEFSPSGSTAEGLFAVFDGHGGREAADYAGRTFPAVVAEQLRRFAGQGRSAPPVDNSDSAHQSTSSAGDVAEPLALVLHRSFIRLQSRMDYGNIGKGGTTAATVIFSKKRIVVANAGDARVVLCANNKVTRISKDHKPTDRDEELRVRGLGGFVSSDGRVNGILAVSSAW